MCPFRPSATDAIAALSSFAESRRHTLRRTQMCMCMYIHTHCMYSAPASVSGPVPCRRLSREPDVRSTSAEATSRLHLQSMWIGAELAAADAWRSLAANDRFLPLGVSLLLFTSSAQVKLQMLQLREQSMRVRVRPLIELLLLVLQSTSHTTADYGRRKRRGSFRRSPRPWTTAIGTASFTVI